ncbi:MAG: hypothetical protein CME06_13935 [Gemmatimonadetes bacterium]|nr:hypothetical protein [Gemmatimonadota bacterium]
MPTEAQVDWSELLRFPWLVPFAIVFFAWRVGGLLQDGSVWDRRATVSRAGPPIWARLAVVAAALVALAMRLYRIGAEPMDLLEYTYYFMSAGRRSIADLLFAEISIQQAHQPVPHLILALLSRVSAGNEGWMRIPSALLGVAAIPVVWTWAREILPGRERIAVAVAWLVALHPIEIWYGRDMTPYGLFALLAAGSYLFLWRGLERGTHWRAFVLVSAINFYVQYYEIWVLFSQILLVSGYVLFAKQRPRPWYAAGQAVRAMAIWSLCVTPWLPFFFKSLTLGYASLNATGPAYSADLTLRHALNEGYRQMIGLPPAAWGSAVLVFAVAIQALGAGTLWRRHRAAAIVVLTPILGGVLTELLFYWKLHSLTDGYYLQIRHYIYIVPFSAILLVTGVAQAARPFHALRPRLAEVAIAGLTAAMVVAQLAYGRRIITGGQRSDVREIVRSIRAKLEDGDAIALLPASFYSHLFSYYFLEPGERGDDLFGSEAWRRLRRADGRTAMIYSPLTEHRLPYRYGAENLFLSRLWIVHFQEEVLDLRKFGDAPYEELLASLNPSRSPLETIEADRIRADLIQLDQRRELPWTDDRVVLDMQLMDTEHAWLTRRSRDPDGQHRIELRVPVGRIDTHFELSYRMRWESRSFLPPRRIKVDLLAEGRRIERFAFQESEGVRELKIRRELIEGDSIDLVFRTDRPLWFKQPPFPLEEGFTLDWLVLEKLR